MPLVLFQAHRFGATQLDDLAINPNAHESLAFGFFDDVAKFTRLILHERRQQNDFALRRVGQNLIDDLLRGLPKDRLSGDGVVGLADGGE